MGWGKMLGLAVLGVGAVAAAPFTGGGSILGAATAAASLAGAGTAAAAVGAGAAGAVAGKMLSDAEESEKIQDKNKIEEQNIEIKKFNLKAEKFHKIISEHEQRDEYTLAISSLFIAMANVDGYISEEEKKEIYLVGKGLSEYSEGLENAINKLIEKPEDIETVVERLKEIKNNKYQELIEFLEVIALVDDNIIDDNEKQFIAKFKSLIQK